MENSEFEKSKVFDIDKALEYVGNTIVTKTICKCSTGYVSVLAFDADQVFSSAASAFDTLIQIIEGKAKITIGDAHYLLGMGQSMILPANCRNSIKSNGRFKMQSTVIKSGFEI